VSKLSQQIQQIGPKGGHFTISKGGKKYYVTVKPAEAMNESIQQGIKQGGATIEPSTGKLVTKGYVVSVNKGLEKPVAKALCDAAAVNEYRNGPGAKEALTKPGAKLGMWYNEKDGNVYLDVSQVEDTREKALDLGRSHQQIAIWDLNEGHEVKTGYQKANLVSKAWDRPRPALKVSKIPR
jgi:hypothetical protein